MRKLQKIIKKRRNKLNNKYYGELADNINKAAEAREVEKEFALSMTYTTLKPGSKLPIPNEKLRTNFESHFAARELPPELAHPEQFAHLNDEVVVVNEDAPNEEEVKSVLKGFKNKKSSGTDQLKQKA